MREELLPEYDPNYTGPLCASGYGLNEDQQRFGAKMRDWMEDSKRSKIILGGPIEVLVNN